MFQSISCWFVKAFSSYYLRVLPEVQYAPLTGDKSPSQLSPRLPTRGLSATASETGSGVFTESAKQDNNAASEIQSASSSLCVSNHESPSTSNAAADTQNDVTPDLDSETRYKGLDTPNDAQQSKRSGDSSCLTVNSEGSAVQMSSSPHFSENHFMDTEPVSSAAPHRVSFSLSNDDEYEFVEALEKSDIQTRRPKSDSTFDELDPIGSAVRETKARSYTESESSRRGSLQKNKGKSMKRQGSRIIGKENRIYQVYDRYLSCTRLSEHYL